MTLIDVVCYPCQEQDWDGVECYCYSRMKRPSDGDALLAFVAPDGLSDAPGVFCPGCASWVPNTHITLAL